MSGIGPLLPHAAHNPRYVKFRVMFPGRRSPMKPQVKVQKSREWSRDVVAAVIGHVSASDFAAVETGFECVMICEHFSEGPHRCFTVGRAV